MYNADRSFSEAERAASRGDLATANTAYLRAVQKAKRQVEKDSVGRYGDDALLILGRSQLALGQYDSAAINLTRLAARENTPLANAARAWLGAVSAARKDTAAALQHLNAALESNRLDKYTAGVAHLWRARIHVGLNNGAAALQDLEASARSHERLVAPAALLGARIAFERADTAALRTQFTKLFAAASGAFYTDSIRSFVREYGDVVEPAALAAALGGIERADWPRMRRDSIALLLVTLLQQSGDTTSAIAAADRVARRSTPPLSDEARYLTARMMLARTRAASELVDVRNVLLPALAHPQSRELVQTLKTIDVLLETAARTGQPLSLFVAAEISRDQLQAPLLARQLFVAYADVARGAVWSGKALLAAAALPQPSDSADALRERIASTSGNVYIDAIHGRDDNAAFADAEDRLARSAQALRNAATIEASQRETAVGRAVTMIDSVALAARTDSMKISCGVLVDSLAVSGIRADSVRSACMRRDRERVTALMKMDTLMLRDSTKARADSLRARGDTASHHQ